MSTKELVNKNSDFSRNFFDFPTQFDWFDDFIPRGLLLRSPELKPIKIEEYAKDGKLVIRAELPGADPDKDLDVSVLDGYLTIKGTRHKEFEGDHHSEFSYGSFSRSIALPMGFDEKSIHAEYKNGILEVSLLLPTAISTGKKIQITKSK